MLPSLANDPNASKDDFETEKAAEWTTKTADVAAGPDGRVVVDLAADYMISANEVNATPEETQSVLRKIDKRLIAMLVFVYFLQFGDKISLGYASLMNIRRDLGLVGQQYSWSSSVFYGGFLLAEIPAVYLLKRLPIGTFMSVNIVLWGAILTLHSVASNYGSLVALRFLLGAFEAPITPACMALLSMWYPRYEQGKRASWFLGANGLAMMICPPIAYGLSAITSSTIASWKLLFILFGLVTFITGAVYIFFMPNNVTSVKWLTTREKAVAIASLKDNGQGSGNYTFQWYQVKEAFMDPRTYLIFLFSATMNIPNGGVTSFGNLVISGLGFDSRTSLLLSMPTGFVDGGMKLLMLRLSDKYKDRTFFAMISISICFIGGLLLIFVPRSQPGPLLLGYFMLYAAGSSWGLCMTLISNNAVGWTKKSTVNGVQIFAYGIGNLIGPQTFRSTDAPDYRSGKILVAVFYGIALIILGLLRLVNYRENKKRDRLQAEHPEKYVQDPDAAIKDLTDFEQPAFRYTL